MMHLYENIKLIRLISDKTQPEFGKLFGATKAMIVSYEKGKAKPDELFIKRLAKYAGVTIHQLKHELLSEENIKVEKDEKVDNGEKKSKGAASPSNIDLLAAEDFKKFRGLVFARISAVEANLRALNNKVADINKLVTGETTTKTLTELEQTTREVQKMLLEELHRIFP
jgi:transcriptional regulator with XRE-family HTH domain